MNELRKIDSECTILIHPENLNSSEAKDRARRAIDKMRENDMDFVKLGKKNAEKAMGKKSG